MIIAGFGRYGQIVGRLLLANGIQPTVLDHDSERSKPCAASAGAPSTATRRGWICCAWPAPATARVLVVAIDDIAQSLALVDLAREHFPQLTVIARARNVQHWYQLNDRGVRPTSSARLSTRR